jgi:hypothetical protein
MAALRKYSLTHLSAAFKDNKVDVVAFRSITEANVGCARSGVRISGLKA